MDGWIGANKQRRRAEKSKANAFRHLPSARTQEALICRIRHVGVERTDDSDQPPISRQPTKQSIGTTKAVCNMNQALTWGIMLTILTRLRFTGAFSSRSSFTASRGTPSRKYSSTTLSMKLQTAIVGLPNVGKSTLFNALTETQGAEAANYPFCTIERKSAHLFRRAIPCIGPTLTQGFLCSQRWNC